MEVNEGFNGIGNSQVEDVCSKTLLSTNQKPIDHSLQSFIKTNENSD